jgi:hypothetical protein
VLLLAVAAGCSGTSTTDTAAPAQPAPSTPEPAPPEPATPAEPMTPEECTAAGGQVRGDIGDGKIACAEGERELGRVRLGIEGGVCCAAGAPP